MVTRTVIMNTRVKEIRYKIMRELEAMENRIFELRGELGRVDYSSAFHRDLEDIEKLTTRFRRRYFKMYEEEK